MQARLVFDDALSTELKEFLTCGICYMTATADREPVECASCRNQLFCLPCINNWVQHNHNCPYCNQPTKFVDACQQVKDMIAALKFKCQWCEQAFTHT